PPLAAPKVSPGVRQSGLHRPLFLPEVQQASLLPDWFSRAWAAAEPNVEKLNQWVPDDKEIQAYLIEVRNLLAGLSEKVAAKSKLPDEHKPIYRQIVFAAAWQESCWRQYIKKGKNLTPLASAT